MSDEVTKCEDCELPIYLIDHSWVVMGTGTTADGLTYCPPDPDHDGELGFHHPPCWHEWVAGMMIVHTEDLDQVAAVRKVTCSRCDREYDPKSE